jgi:transposase-like protein
VCPHFVPLEFDQKKNSMRARIKATIKHLKSQAKKQTIRRRRLKGQLKERDAKIAQLTAELGRLRKITEPEKVFNHCYPAQMIVLAVFIVVHAGGSLRCAAKTVAFFAKMMGWASYTEPSPTTIRNWVIRCGYHALSYARDIKGDYVAIIDESIQIGKEKLLLLLGVKIDAGQCYSAPLCGADVEVLGMEVQDSWTSPSIARFIKGCLERHPGLRLRHVISDRGTSLLAAMRSLSLPWASDCSHVMMNAVKDIFGKDKALSQLCASIGQLRMRLTLSAWGGLLPPSLRDKDRFLRIFTIVEWAARMDSYWDRLPGAARRHIAFYRKAWPLIRRLRQVKEVIVIASDILKKAGLSGHSFERWQKSAATYLASQKVATADAKAFVAKIDAYFAEHAELYKGRCQVLCCSDIIESTFGRYKNKGGMRAISADVLSIALYNQEISCGFVQSAMASVSCQDVEDWQTDNVCHNRYGLRKIMDEELKSVG